MRIALPLMIGVNLALATASANAATDSNQPVKLEIHSQLLRDALNDWAQQTGYQLISPTSAVTSQFVVAGISAELTPRAALERLLAGTSLTYELINDRTAVIEDRSVVGWRKISDGSPQLLALASDAQQQSTNTVERVAQTESADGRRQTSPTSTSGGKDSRRIIEEVFVTAQKKSERLQDVPVPLTAVAAESLVATNQTQMQDYYTKVPGLSLSMLGDVGSPTVSIRGLTTGGYVTPTVGTTVDDVPFGASTVLGGGALVADLDPSELQRIEILRGPQGTLYGANSLGGLIKYVTIDPSTDAVAGNLQAGSTYIEGGEEFGYTVRGGINLPVNDSLALRASGSMRNDPGYVDNIRTNEEDINSIDAESARVAMLWRPRDNLSVKLSALWQSNDVNGSSDTHLPSAVAGAQTTAVSGSTDLEDLEQVGLRGTGVQNDELQAYSATVKLSLGRAELTSLSGYNVKDGTSELDSTPVFPTLPITQFGVSGVKSVNGSKASKLSQELRLSMPIGERFDWLLGAFYTKEDYDVSTDILAVDPTTGATAGSWLTAESSGEYEEYAAYTNLTVSFSDRFDIQFGARQSHNEFAVEPTTQSGPFNTVVRRTTFTTVTPRFDASDDSLTYLVTPRFKFSGDLMLYARLASGYRPGGPNTNIQALNAGFPRAYQADTTQNYEIGFKGALLDRKLSIDASVYYIDWKDIQVQLRDNLIVYTVNAARARSQGAELALGLRPLEGLSVSAWGAYIDAELTEIPASSFLRARPGDSLPYTPRRSGGLSFDQEFPLGGGGMTGFVGASVSYVGERSGRFFANVPQSEFPSYTQVDMQVGAKMDAWTLNLFVNNVGDTRGVLRSGRDSVNSLLYSVTYTQPRTMGLLLTRAF